LDFQAFWRSPNVVKAILNGAHMNRLLCDDLSKNASLTCFDPFLYHFFWVATEVLRVILILGITTLRKVSETLWLGLILGLIWAIDVRGMRACLSRVMIIGYVLVNDAGVILSSAYRNLYV
jgi:hypothetical protein